jgi:predicted aspartyl protease
MENIATVQIYKQGQVPFLAGRVNDYPLMAILDTGAAQTSLFGSFTKKTSLDVRIVDRLKSGGIGGMGDTGYVHAKSLTFGPLWEKNVDLNVIMSDRVGADALLGVDVLFAKYDLELAMAEGQIRFFQPVDCDQASLAYWDQSASVVPMTTISAHDPRRMIELQINGKSARALIDSGAERSVVDANFARLIGLLDDSSDNLKKGTLVGAGPNAVDFTVVPVKKIVIGKEIIRDTAITVAEILRAMMDDSSFSPQKRRQARAFDMVLGEDFLSSHRVLLSVSQERLYFSYLGGSVFAVN